MSAIINPAAPGPLFAPWEEADATAFAPPSAGETPALRLQF